MSRKKQASALDALYAECRNHVVRKAKELIEAGEMVREDIVFLYIRIGSPFFVSILDSVAGSKWRELSVDKIVCVCGARRELRKTLGALNDAGAGLGLLLVEPPKEGCIVILLCVDGRVARKELMV